MGPCLLSEKPYFVIETRTLTQTRCVQDNRLSANLTEWKSMGDLRQLITLDMYNNQMYGAVPASVQNLTSLQYLYLDNQHYKPLRQKYCGQRLPNLGKYSYRIVREECALPRPGAVGGLRVVWRAMPDPGATLRRTIRVPSASTRGRTSLSARAVILCAKRA